MVRTSSFLEILRLRETLLAQLYRNFAELFPGYEDFWLEMARDEDRYAQIVASVEQQLAQEKSTSDLLPQKLYAFYEYYIELSQLAYASDPQFSLYTCQEAIWLTLYIEELTAQQIVVDQGDHLDGGVVWVLNKLKSETTNHFKSAHEFVEENHIEDPDLEHWGFKEFLEHLNQRVKERGLPHIRVFTGKSEVGEKSKAERDFESTLTRAV